MDIQQVFTYLKKDLDRIERDFSKYTLSEISLMTKISKYILSSGGKRVRPSICVLSSRMCGYKKAKLYPIACAVELLHNATLLHDDVIDSAEIRRGKQAANALWNNKASVLVGDFMITQVFDIVVKSRNFKLLDLFTQTTEYLVNGEIYQMLKEKDTHITKDEYFYIIKNKTAVLISVAAESGAILAERSDKEIRALKSFGMNIDMAFQIIDDALDYAADEAVLGKAVLSDLAEGKVTLPIIHILEEGGDADKALLSAIIEKDKHTAGDMKKIMRMINKYDSVGYATGIARKFAKKATNKLKQFPDCKEKEALLTISDFVVDRKY